MDVTKPVLISHLRSSSDTCISVLCLYRETEKWRQSDQLCSVQSAGGFHFSPRPAVALPSPAVPVSSVAV